MRSYSTEEFNELIKEKGLVLVDFFASKPKWECKNR